MNNIANINNLQKRQELFNETAIRKSLTQSIVEKDFWVCWTLGKLFEDSELSKRLVFKGGTSLSKVFNIIERFSEDIDLILDWTLLTEKNPKSDISKTKQEKLNKTINKSAIEYISGPLLMAISNILAPTCSVSLDRRDPHIINITYPSVYKDSYLRSDIRLEIGPLASWLPNSQHTISSYVAEEFPNVFTTPSSFVYVINAERTFWEKITILHHEAHRPETSQLPSRYSRHYYDVFRMAHSYIKERALTDLKLLNDVVAFKERFYPRSWAKYDLAKPGTLKLIPNEHVIKELKKDYDSMQNMIFGEYPSFNTIIKTIVELEIEINSLNQN